MKIYNYKVHYGGQGDYTGTIEHLDDLETTDKKDIVKQIVATKHGLDVSKMSSVSVIRDRDAEKGGSTQKKPSNMKIFNYKIFINGKGDIKGTIEHLDDLETTDKKDIVKQIASSQHGIDISKMSSVSVSRDRDAEKGGSSETKQNKKDSKKSKDSEKSIFVPLWALPFKLIWKLIKMIFFFWVR